jgi:hypothetical protein
VSSQRLIYHLSQTSTSTTGEQSATHLPFESDIAIYNRWVVSDLRVSTIWVRHHHLQQVSSQRLIYHLSQLSQSAKRWAVGDSPISWVWHHCLPQVRSQWLVYHLSQISRITFYSGWADSAEYQIQVRYHNLQLVSSQWLTYDYGNNLQPKQVSGLQKVSCRWFTFLLGQISPLGQASSS